jgi:hypothetical protein
MIKPTNWRTGWSKPNASAAALYARTDASSAVAAGQHSISGIDAVTSTVAGPGGYSVEHASDATASTQTTKYGDRLIWLCDKT